MALSSETTDAIRNAVNSDRLVDTAVKLVATASPTRAAASVADCLETILREDGFDVERPVASWAEAPAVVGRYTSGSPGKCLQFNGHLDTVHLPFVPPRVDQGILFGSGASDMKGGIASAVEAMRALRDCGLLTTGSVLLTAHDLHETPWGDGSQVNALIDEGYVGDAVLLPEYLSDRLPIVGRGLAVLSVKISRSGEPVHEVLGGIEAPSVIAAGAAVIGRFLELDQQLQKLSHPMAGRESMFVGQVHSGEIFNQAPVELQLSGTRRWLPNTEIQFAETQYRSILADVAADHKLQIEGQFQVARDAFELDEQDAFVQAFQVAYTADAGRPLDVGAKPFVDDGNAFIRRGGVPAITHGPNAKGAHTVNEEVPVSELVRVANVYALTALEFCGG